MSIKCRGACWIWQKIKPPKCCVNPPNAAKAIGFWVAPVLLVVLITLLYKIAA